MKYLPEPKLNKLSALLSTPKPGPSRVNVRFEAYSIKQVRDDRKMYKEMEEAYMSGQEEMDVMSFSPEMKEAGLSSCFGRLDEKESRKVHYLLVSTLNAAFPEHDFSALKPDHFTREPNAAIVLEQMSGDLLFRAPNLPIMSPPGSSPLLRPTTGSSLSSSPSHAPMGSAGDLYRHLCEVVPLDECEVYSWFPSPEYDPHVAPEDGEESDDAPDYDYDDDVADRMDLDESEGHGQEASWGQAGMEMEVEESPGGGVQVAARDSRGKRRSLDSFAPPAAPMSKRMSEDDGRGSGGGLLWSVNYFFYSKRSKRILFSTCWSRKRSAPHSSPPDIEFAPFSSSLTSPPTTATSPFAARKPRTKPRHKPHARPQPVGKPPPKPSAKGEISSLIPIRGMSPAPPRTPGRLASSAPAPMHSLSSFGPHPSSVHFHTPSPASALARMSANGIKPRLPSQTPTPRAQRVGPAPAQVGRQGQGHGQGQGQGEDSRVRKNRSESTTPGPQSLLSAAAPRGEGAGAGLSTGKRAKV